MSKKRLLYSITRQKSPIFKKDTELSPVSIWKLASAQSLASTNPNSPSGIKSYKGNTHQFYASHYSDENNPSQVFTWSTESGGNSVMTVSADGLVTLVGAGEDKVVFNYSSATINKTYKFRIDVALLPDGIYFLKNKGTSYYADISGQTMSNGTDVVQYEFTGDNSQRWRLEYFGDQYYCIVSANSLTNYYLGVENDSILNDAQIEIRTGTVTDGMKWKIEVTSSGAYKLIPKSGELYSKAIAVKNDAVEGSPVLQRLYSCDTNYRDEWFI